MSTSNSFILNKSTRLPEHFWFLNCRTYLLPHQITQTQGRKPCMHSSILCDPMLSFVYKNLIGRGWGGRILTSNSSFKKKKKKLFHLCCLLSKHASYEVYCKWILWSKKDHYGSGIHVRIYLDLILALIFKML